MVRRALITTITGIVLITLFAWAYGQFFAESPTSTVTRPLLRHAAAKPWDGTARSTYDTTFVRASDQVNLQTVTYTGLNTAAANVTASIVVTPGAPTKPAWLSSQSFSIRSAGARVYDPQVSIAQNGATYNVTVQAQSLPTSGLGSTCSAQMTPQNALGLFVYSPDGQFVVQLTPPPAPAGHCFDTPVTRPATCSSAALTVSSLRSQDGARRRAIRHAHGRARRRLVAANKRALRAEAPSRAQAKAIVATPNCNPPQPSPGRPLSAYDKLRDRSAARAALAGGGYVPPALTGH